MQIQKPCCSICSSFRELTLHLHELSLFCTLLNNELPIYSSVKKKKKVVGIAKTNSIAKWLRLASQLDTVEMNTFRYEESHVYCEPVLEHLKSNEKHDSSLATQITRFIFISNALEEAYRLSSPLYEKRLTLALGSGNKVERQRSHSTQMSWLIDHLYPSLELPVHYFHKVNGLIEMSKVYRDVFNVSFDMVLENNEMASRGFSVVRNLRNHIAHAVFPIIENPEYTWEYHDSNVKALVLKLLMRASRLAAMNVQIIVGLTCSEFKSSEYFFLSEDLKNGDTFMEDLSINYVNNLHIEQKFGLNECSRWSFRSSIQED